MSKRIIKVKDSEKIDYKTLTNELIERLCERYGIQETISLLLDVGCTKNELIKLQFNDDDIEEVVTLNKLSNISFEFMEE